MIDERLREAAANLRALDANQVPDLVLSSRPRVSVAVTAVVAALVAAGAVWALSTRNTADRAAPPTVAPTTALTDVSTLPAATSVPDPAAPTTAEIDTSTPTPATSPPDPTVPTSVAPPSTVPQPAVPGPVEMSRAELTEWAGTWTLHPQTAVVQLGSSGTVTYTLDMTESSLCIRTESRGSACEYTDDGSPLVSERRVLQGGGGGRTFTPASWYQHYIAPADVELQLVHRSTGEPACEMARFDLDPYADGDFWACDAPGPEPDDLALLVIRGDTSALARVS